MCTRGKQQGVGGERWTGSSAIEGPGWACSAAACPRVRGIAGGNGEDRTRRDCAAAASCDSRRGLSDPPTTTWIDCLGRTTDTDTHRIDRLTHTGTPGRALPQRFWGSERSAFASSGKLARLLLLIRPRRVRRVMAEARQACWGARGWGRMPSI